MTKATKCAYKKCKNKHKNTSGYCVEHAHHAERHVIYEPPTRRCAMPLLHEEKLSGNR